VEQQWNVLGALADRVLRQAAEAREASVGQLRDAEAAQGQAAHEGPAGRWPRAGGTQSRQLELPLL